MMSTHINSTEHLFHCCCIIVNASLFEYNPVKLAARHPADDILLFAAGGLCLRSEINLADVRNAGRVRLESIVARC